MSVQKIRNNMSSGLIREMPEIMRILLIDRTTNGNIIWATDSYAEYGKGYQVEDIVSRPLVTGKNSNIIKPRVLKEKEEQKTRTKSRAEVMTPVWVINRQVQAIHEELEELSLIEYTNKTWLEITCGEGPYIVSPYDTTTGKSILLTKRVGFLDRKIQRISKKIDNHDEWIEMTFRAYKASYGYDFQGDSLLIARENLLYTFMDYYIDKFRTLPHFDYIEEIAIIISYNIFQMDGLKYIIPFSGGVEYVEPEVQLDLFGYEVPQEPITIEKEPINVKIKKWETGEMIEFRKLLE